MYRMVNARRPRRYLTARALAFAVMAEVSTEEVEEVKWAMFAANWKEK